jgi:hypothetical protein
MKKLVLTAVAGLVATALTGASANSALGDTKVHTKRLVSRDIASHSLGANTFAGAAVDRHAGHVVGYDTFTGHFYPKQDRGVIWDSLALKNGTITVVVHFKGNATVFTGRILHGTGKYKGIDGTVTARPAPHNENKTFITLTYHF